MNMPHCVLCWCERELLRQASYIYDGMSLCARHLHLKMADNLKE